MKDVLIKLAQTGKLFLGIALGFSAIWHLDWAFDVGKWTQALDLLIALLSSITLFFSGVFRIRAKKGAGK